MEEEEREGTGTSQTSELHKIHYEALKDFNLSVDQALDERKLCLEDRRFYSIAGAQWEGQVGDLFENKPKLEVNKGHSAIIRIFNEYRANRITVDYISRDGIDRTELADTCDQLYRADEMKSTADEAYDNAFEEAVGGGFGAWRYRADLEDEFDIDNEYQKICIEPIFDADSCVFFNREAMRQDKSDATKCWVLIPYTLESYKEEFEDDPVTWPKEIESGQFDWASNNKVYVAEYYKVEIIREDVVIFINDEGDREIYSQEEIDDDPNIPSTMALQLYRWEGTKKRKRKRVHKYLMSGGGILEDCGYIAGTEIPIVPMFGKRWVVDSIERMMGHIRLYKDPQRVKNAQYSKLLEVSALSSVEKPIFAAEQINPYWQEWADDNIKNYPALRIASMCNKEGDQAPAGPLGYTRVPNIPPALAALLELTEKDMQDILGNQQQGDKIVSNISGEAIERIQNRLDMQTFIYMSNFAKAMRRGGQIWLSMAKDLYTDPGRKMMALGKENKVGFIEIQQPDKDEKTGKTIYKNDFRDANFEIMVDVGPSFSSKKAKIVRELTDVLQMTPAASDAETATILISMIMMNLEGEGMQGVREYYRKKLLKLGVEQPSEQEKQEMLAELENMPPNANEEYLKAAAQNEQAKATKAAADTRKIIAETEETIAKTAETLAGIDRDDQQAAVDTAAKIQQSLQSGNQPTAQNIQTVEQ